MYIALATCSDLPGWEVDDIPLHEALSARGVSHAQICWDDPDVDWSRFDGCLVRTTWDYSERQAEFVAWAHRVSSQTRLWNSASVLEWNSDKHYLADLESHGVATAPTIWLAPGVDYDVGQLMGEHGWTKGFIKPQIGAMARETVRFDRDTVHLAEAHLERMLKTEAMLLQPYLSSVETTGEISVFFFGGERCHAVQKIPVPGDYRVQDDFGATDFPIEAPSAVVDTARRAVEAAQVICGLAEPLVADR